MKQYFENLIKILNDSLKSIDENVFEQLKNDCAEVLKKGKKL